MHGRARESMDGATQIDALRMKMDWPWMDLQGCQYAYGFLLVNRQQVNVPLSVGFSSVGNSSPAHIWSSWKTSLWPAGVLFSLSSLWTTQGLSDELTGLLLHWIRGENSVKYRLLPSIFWSPCAKPLFCPDLWDTAACFSVSTRSICVKLWYTQL